MHLWVISGVADTPEMARMGHNFPELCEPITAMVERSMPRPNFLICQSDELVEIAARRLSIDLSRGRGPGLCLLSCATRICNVDVVTIC